MTKLICIKGDILDTELVIGKRILRVILDSTIPIEEIEWIYINFHKNRERRVWVKQYSKKTENKIEISEENWNFIKAFYG